MSQRFVVRQSRSFLQTNTLATKKLLVGFDPVCRRTFFGATSPLAPLTLHASRTLPYGVEPLFDLISDVSNYPLFIPFCTDATVHSFSAPDAKTGRRWPAKATLRVGFSSLSESYVSRVYCVPYSVVEAVSGSDISSSIAPGELEHYAGEAAGTGTGKSGAENVANELFSSLRARWTLQPHRVDAVSGVKLSNEEGHSRTTVSLAIEAHWKNPMLAATSNAFAPSVAGKVVEAFERKAKEALG